MASYEETYEALIARKVEVAVAPYRGLVPPEQFAVLERLASDVYRRHPVAAAAIEDMARRGVSHPSVEIARGDLPPCLADEEADGA